MTQMTPELALDAARETISTVGFCVLVTRGRSGGANARLMQPFLPSEDLTIWMGASPASRKVREIERYWRVTLTYSDPGAGAYVSLLGTATIVTDLNLRQRYWREEFRPFWPEGPHGRDYALIRFQPSRIEAMHVVRGVAPPPFGLRPAVLEREGAAWVSVPYDEEG